MSYNCADYEVLLRYIISFGNFSGTELQGVEVVGQSKTSNNIVPLLNIRVAINTDEIQIIIKSDLN